MNIKRSLIFDILHSIIYNKKIGPHFFEAFKNRLIEKSSTDGYFVLLMGYARSPFRDSERYVRIVVGLDEENFPIIVKQSKWDFIT